MNEQLPEEEIEAKRQHTEEALRKIKNLPMIPKVMFEVTKMLQSPSVTTSSLAKLIGKDQGLTTKILSIANSPLYGLQRKVTSLEFAIIVLGYKEISDIVTALSLADAIKVSSDKNFNQNDFWIHSMVVGTAARGISQTLGFMDIGSDAFVAGVLHEMGIQLLYKFFNEEFLVILEKVRFNNFAYLDSEKEVLGLTHQEMGRFIAEKWNLPKILCDVLNHHHYPYETEENKVITSIVHLADYMTQKFQIADFYWDINMKLDPDIITTLQFKYEENLERFINDYRDLFFQTASTMRL